MFEMLRFFYAKNQKERTENLANNINQITKRVNSGEPVTEETLRLIADMQSQIWEKLKAF